MVQLLLLFVSVFHCPADEEASYSSPVSGRFKDQPFILFLTRANLIATDPLNGKIFWRLPFGPPIRTSVTAATPLVIDDLWGLTFGNGGDAGDTNTLFFAAGINDEADGLFGSLAPAN